MEPTSKVKGDTWLDVQGKGFGGFSIKINSVPLPFKSLRTALCLLCLNVPGSENLT